MKAYLIELLKQLEQRIPPPPNCHHCITYAQYGSDETGWTDQLALQINRDGKWHCFFLDQRNLDTSIQTTVDDIAGQVLGEIPKSAQLGFGPGQFLSACSKCGGSGILYGNLCLVCSGSGTIYQTAGELTK